MNAYDQSMNAIYVHSISYKIITKHDTRHTQVSIFFWRNVRVAINFAGMLLVSHEVAYVQYVATWDDKKLWVISGDIEMKTHKM